MPHKGKLPPEEKVRIVQEYLSGQLGASEFARKYEIRKNRLYEWTRLYQTRGAEGLIPATRFRRYSPETKYSAVQDYLSGKASVGAICAKYDISKENTLKDWVKWYNGHGDFKQPNTGGTIYMEKGRKTTLDERIEIVSHCISNNRDYGKTIEKYGVSYQQIYGWVRKYEKDGADGLLDKRGKRKSEITMSEIEKLKAQLKFQKAENSRLQMENELLKKLEALERRRDAD